MKLHELIKHLKSPDLADYDWPSGILECDVVFNTASENDLEPVSVYMVDRVINVDIEENPHPTPAPGLQEWIKDTGWVAKCYKEDE